MTQYLTFPTSKKRKHDDDDDANVQKIPLHFPPQVFRQANLTAFAAIVDSIRTHIQKTFRPNEN